MHIEAYLRVLSDEDRIHSIQEETNLPNARIKPLKARRGDSTKDVWWNWQTERIAIDVDNPDEGLKTFLEAHRAIFPIIKKYRGPDADIYLEVVTKYEEGEEPRGLFLSAETIDLLSELGGSFDNDVVGAVGAGGRTYDGG
jgi:hypothetical protein